jgi:cysteinyl-tRNA synthetase
MIHFHNTLTGSLEEFAPLEPGKVKMYHCGPTVYDYVHIGNLRSFLLADILRRTLEYLGFETKQVLNITDVGIGGNNDEGEDKILSGLKREGKEITMENMKALGEFYTERFKEDIAALNIKMPHVMPKASEHLGEMIEMIKTLEAKGFTYQTSDGIYFDTSKDPHYGKLTRSNLVEQGSTLSRIAENSGKKNSRDFALWKFNQNLGFHSPWGQGFPGWHIECSAMATKYLGNTFDIHTGGMDLAPVHHNNEIAQSENVCDCEFARYWLHNEFVNVAEGKMAKSEGTGITLSDVAKAGFNPLSYRYFLLMAHYRSPVTFSWEALTAAANAYDKLKKFVERYTSPNPLLALGEGGDDSPGEVDVAYKAQFVEKLENDLNTAQALAVLWTLVKDKNVPNNVKLATLKDFDKVLGLGL